MRVTKVGSLLNKKDRQKAAILVSKGEVAGIYNRGVCALWFNGGDSKAIEKIRKIKGEGRSGKPVALTLSMEGFVSLIDLKMLPEDVKGLLCSPDFKSRVGSLCFIRAPLLMDHREVIPKQAMSFEDGVCMIQNWDAFGHDLTEHFLLEVGKLGVKHPAVTSMNTSGLPEIVDQKEGEIFCKKFSIPIFLKDPSVHPEHKGSYTIITLDKYGVTLSREGNIPGWIIEQVLGFSLIKDKTKKSNYPPMEFPKSLLKDLPPNQTRIEVLQYLKDV